MTTKPKAILSTMDNREASPITKASNVLFENGQTAQDILNDRQDAMISPVIENSSSMFKVGQGDNADFSENVANGAYESVTLKGKTMVNCIQEPSSQDVVLPYEFEEGQYVTINDTKESGALGVELKGQTLVNLFTTITTKGFHHQATNDGNKGFTMTGDGTTSCHSWWNIELNTSKKYLLSFNIIQNTADKELCLKTGDETPIRTLDVGTLGEQKIIFTPTESNIRFKIEQHITGILVVDNIKLIEYREGMENWDIPYFEGMASVNMPTVKTYNGEYDFQVGKYMTSGTLSDGQHWLFFNCKPNTKYEITVKSGNYNRFGVYSYNGELGKTLTSDKTFYNYITANPNTVYSATGVTGNKANLIGVYLSNNNHNTTLDDVVLEVLENGRKLSDKTSILSLPEEVVLKGIDGIKDTLNCNTGEYVQRIKEIVFDGSSDENWGQNGQHTDGSYRHICNTYTDAKVSSDNVLCDKMSFVKVNGTTGEGITSDIHITYTTTTGKVQIATTKTLAELKTWLSQNPITVQYELATPIITKINLPSTLKSWNTTTHIYSEIPENTLYPILSHSNPTYPVILKPSTKYSIVANSYSNDHINSTINFNLGGTNALTTVGNRVTTITTPSTLTSEELVMSGRGNKLGNVMVIEGDVVGDEPYFEGICDCKSPILSNVGKNLFNINGEWHKSTYSHSVPALHNGSQTMLVLEDGVQITTNNNQYHAAFGQFINIRGINNLRISFTGEYTDTKTVPEIVVQLLHKDEELPKTMSSTLASTDYNHRKTSFNLSQSGETVSKTINTQGYECAYVHVCGNYLSSMSGTYTFIARNICVEDADRANVCEPYKSNILSANGDEIKLTEDMFEQGGVSYPNTYPTTSTFDSIKYPSDHRIRMKDLHSIKPNTTHKIKIQNGDSYWIGLQGYNNDGVPINFDTSWGWYGGECVFTTPSNMTKFAIAIRKPDSSVITLSDFGKIEFELREVDKTIVLRSLPNGVCDTLNVETGEYVQRIGEATFDGSSDENWRASQTDSARFVTDFTGDRKVYSQPNIKDNLICDKYKTIGYGEIFGTDGGDGAFGIASYDSNHNIHVRNGLDSTVSDFTARLKADPITVQYELETPIVKTVDLSGYPFSYENGHVQLSSGSIEQSLTPKVEYSVATNRNGQIRSNQKMVERHQKQLDQLQAIILANLVNSQYNQTLTTLKYELSRV